MVSLFIFLTKNFYAFLIFPHVSHHLITLVSIILVTFSQNTNYEVPHYAIL
jgi:hypothetical protein